MRAAGMAAGVRAPLVMGEGLRDRAADRRLYALLQEFTHCDATIHLNLKLGWPREPEATRRRVYVSDGVHEQVFEARPGGRGRWVLVDSRSARVVTRFVDSADGRLTVKLRERCTPTPSAAWARVAEAMRGREDEALVEMVLGCGMAVKMAYDRAQDGVIYRVAQVFRAGARPQTYSATYQTLELDAAP